MIAGKKRISHAPSRSDPARHGQRDRPVAGGPAAGARESDRGAEGAEQG